MKSISLREPGQFVLSDTPLPPPIGQDEVRVRVRKVGVCGTDLHAFTGRQPFFTYPRILGHELALEVMEIGDTQQPHDLHIGDLCCLRPYLNCGTCDACRRGFTNCCMNMQVFGVHRDGGMREVINVPIDKLHKSTKLNDEALALVEMLSIGSHAVRRAHIKPGEVVLVVGVGPIGLGVAQFAALAGARVITTDISDARCAFARKVSAIEHSIDAKQDVIAQLKAVVPDNLPTVVFDATGNAQSMMKSFQFVAHGGRLVFVGLFQGDVTFHDPDFHRRELTLLASRNATAHDFDEVIAALESGKIDVTSWITDRVSPEQLVDAFPNWLAPESQTIKAMMSF